MPVFRPFHEKAPPSNFYSMRLDQPHLHPILRQILLEFLNIYFLPVENTRRQSRVDLRILEEV